MLLKVYKSRSSGVLRITLMYKMPVSFDMHKEFNIEQKKGVIYWRASKLIWVRGRFDMVRPEPRAAKPPPRIGAMVSGTALSKVNCLT